MKRITVHIQRVVLRGIDPASKDRVAADLREALIAGLSEPGAADGVVKLGHRSVLKALSEPSTGDGPAGVGQKAGRMIGRSVIQ